MDVVKTDNSKASVFDWQIIGTTAKPFISHDSNQPCGEANTSTAELVEVFFVPDGSLDTAVILSLFCNRRATDDDNLPYGKTNRQGWCGNEFTDSTDTNEWGSHLWLGNGKVTTENLNYLVFAAKESLEHFIDDGIASDVVVTGEWLSDARLSLHIQIYQTPYNLIYDSQWALSLNRDNSNG